MLLNLQPRLSVHHSYWGGSLCSYMRTMPQLLGMTLCTPCTSCQGWNRGMAAAACAYHATNMQMAELQTAADQVQL